jgi:preprotein translocase subunit SecG
MLPRIEVLGGETLTIASSPNKQSNEKSLKKGEVTFLAIIFFFFAIIFLLNNKNKKKNGNNNNNNNEGEVPGHCLVQAAEPHCPTVRHEKFVKHHPHSG